MMIVNKSQLVIGRYAYMVRITSHRPMTVKLHKLKIMSFAGGYAICHDVDANVPMNIHYRDCGIGEKEALKIADLYSLQRVFSYEEAAKKYMERIVHLRLTPIEVRISGANSTNKYAVYFNGTERQMPIEIYNHSRVDTNEKSTMEFEGQTWYRDNIRSVHSFTEVRTGNDVNVGTSICRVFEDPKEAFDFYMGKF